MLQNVSERLDSLATLSKAGLDAIWRELFGAASPVSVRRELLVRILAYKIQEQQYGGLKTATRRRLRELAGKLERDPKIPIPNVPSIKPGTRLIRQWQGKTYQVTVIEAGYEYNEKRYTSLSEIARLITGTRWSGPLFFGLKGKGGSRSR